MRSDLLREKKLNFRGLHGYSGMTMIDQETLVWYSADAPPDDDQMVLVFAPGADEPVWLGYFDDGSWYECGGAEYGNAEELAAVVTAWAPMPSGATCAESSTSAKA